MLCLVIINIICTPYELFSVFIEGKYSFTAPEWLFTQRGNSEPIYSKRQLGFSADFLDVSTQKLTFPAN